MIFVYVQWQLIMARVDDAGPSDFAENCILSSSSIYCHEYLHLVASKCYTIDYTLPQVFYFCLSETPMSRVEEAVPSDTTEDILSSKFHIINKFTNFILLFPRIPASSGSRNTIRTFKCSNSAFQAC